MSTFEIQDNFPPIDLPNQTLKEMFGKIAILEVSMTIKKTGYLKDIIEALDIDYKLILTNIYQNPSKLGLMPSNNVSTILFETQFAYLDKIYDITKFLVEIYKSTGWKPQYIINTVDYGLKALWYICSKLNIEVYMIDYAYMSSKFDFKLQKIEFSEFQGNLISMKYKCFDELFEDIE